MKKAVQCLCLLLGVITMLSLFGCGKQKYNLIFDGSGFESKKTQYAAGSKVTVYFNMIATDTNYDFWIDDDVKLSRDYNEKDGYVFSFTMPDHDVTMHVSSYNSMLSSNPRRFSVTFSNGVETADVWIIPQTEENLKTSLWGTASAKSLEADSRREITLTKTDEDGLFIVNIIDEDHAYYSAKDIYLGDGYEIKFTTEESKFDAVIEVLDPDGNVIVSNPAFVGTFGGK